MIDSLVFLWTRVLYQPIYNLFIYVYNLTPGPSIGWAVIGLAILIRVLFLSSSIRSFKTDIVIENLEPYIKKIEDEEKFNPRQKRKRLAELFKGKDIDLYGEIYSLLAQVIFLIVLYQVFQYGFKKEGMALLYSFVNRPEVIHSWFFGVDLAARSVVLSLAASFALFIQVLWEYDSKKNATRIRFSDKWFPLLLGMFTYILLAILPSAKALFVLISVLFSMILKVTVSLSLAKKNKRTSLPEPIHV